MLQSDMLTRTFRVFDATGKGYISMDDLQRVLQGLGQSGVGGEWMAGATDGDREGRRITYGSFVRMMAHSVKAAHKEGDYLFRQGADGPRPAPAPCTDHPLAVHPLKHHVFTASSGKATR